MITSFAGEPDTIVGVRVSKNPDEWTSTEYDKPGSGEGVGIIISRWSSRSVIVRWEKTEDCRFLEELDIVPVEVVSVRGVKRDDDSPYHQALIYCGRSMPRLGWSDQGFGNPYSVKHYPDAADRFADDLADAIMGRGNPDPKIVSMIPKLPALRGRLLGCWCGFWREGGEDIGCHAVALARLVNRLPLCR